MKQLRKWGWQLRTSCQYLHQLLLYDVPILVAAFRLLFSSIVSILMAAPLGHLAGWCIDIGTKSVPGLMEKKLWIESY